MEETIQKLLNILFPDGNYVSDRKEGDSPFSFVGYTNVFHFTNMNDDLDSYSHIVEVVNLGDEEIVVNVLPMFVDIGWNNVNKDVMKGTLAAIIHILFPIEKWHEVKYDEKGLFMSAYIKTETKK